MMTNAEINELARDLVGVAKDPSLVDAILASLPNPFPDGAPLVAVLAFHAADGIDTLSNELAHEFGLTPAELRAEYFTNWAARDLGPAPHERNPSDETSRTSR